MKKYKLFFFAAVASFLVSACVYDFVAPVQAPPLNGGGGNGEETVSFASDIIPVFESKCASCHRAGGAKSTPDLTAEKAYTSVYTSTYINLENPEESLIYNHIRPDTDTHTQRKYTAAEAQLVLTWIQEGAQNN